MKRVLNGINDLILHSNYTTNSLFKFLKFYLQGVTTLVKCDLSGSENSCEYFVKDFKTGDLCLKLKQKGQAWSSLIDSITPKLECPIKPVSIHDEIHHLGEIAEY